MLEKFIKTYAGTYQYTTMVRHKGVVVAFAMDANRHIWYTVLDLGGSSQELGSTEQTKSVLDVDAWQQSPTELVFPNEIAEVGYGVGGQTTLPVFKKDAIQPEAEGTPLPPGRPNEYDYFKSTTARFSELAPFQVLSDGRYVYIFRQAINGNRTGSMVYVEKSGHVLIDKNGVKGYVQFDVNANRNQWIDKIEDQDSGRIPLEGIALVNSTLLVDRFLLVGTTLAPKMEVRYQRSRSKNRPASRKDSLGPRDLDGNIFYEPTQELKFIANLTGGRFSVLLLPTAIAEVERWQIFAENGITHRMDLYNVERSGDGLFNTRGSQTYTCADHAQVYAKKEGKCNECGRTLIPRIVNKGYSESALSFDGKDTVVTIPLKREPLTVEAWIQPGNVANEGFIVKTDSYSLSISEFGNLVYTIISKEKTFAVKSEEKLEKGTWYHIAGVLGGYWKTDEDTNDSVYINALYVYLNGREVGRKDISEGAIQIDPCTMDLRVGSSFIGIVDEVRLWGRVRSAVEMQADMYHRLTGLETDLMGYWRFDEGVGVTLHDDTNNMAEGEIKSAIWVISDAPVGEHPGIERTSFEIEGRSFKSAPTSLLYYQQSKAASGYSGEAKPLKNTGRVMLAVATNDGLAENIKKNHIAVLDFGVSASGRLAQIPDEVKLSKINAEVSNDQSFNDLLDHLSSLKASFEEARSRLQYAITFEQDLEDQLAKACIRAYADGSYSGEVREFRLGLVENLASEMFDNIISSIELDPQLQVVVYENPSRGGRSHTYTDSTPWVDVNQEDGTLEKWNDMISSLDVQEKPSFKQQRDEARQVIRDAQEQCDSAEKALKNWTSRWEDVKNGVSATMPRLHTDPLGLTISAGLLEFAWTSDSPLLFDSATGKLALYFRGGNDQFFVTYYDTFTERASISLDVVTCYARSTDYPKVTIKISGKSDDDTCMVEITNAGKEETGDIVETWKNVPRSADEFAKVLNGQATGHTYIGSGVGAKDEKLLAVDEPGTRRAINSGATLMVGNERIIVKEQVFPGSLQIPYESDFKLPDETLPVFLVEYDYRENTSCKGLSTDLSNGSAFIRVLPGATSGASITPSQEGVLVSTVVCKWTAAAPGSTVSLDGQEQFLEIANNDFDTANDLTLEAWVKPSRVDNTARVIQHRSDNTGYTLALKRRKNVGLVLDGVDDYVQIPTTELFNFRKNQNFTVESWIKVSSQQADRKNTDNDIIEKWSGGQIGYPFVIRFDNRPGTCQLIAARYNGSENPRIETSLSRPLNDDEYHHVAFVKDGTKLLLYIDGKPAGETVDTTHSAKGDTNNASPLYLGRRGEDRNKNYFTGGIDEVRIWKRARTQAEIQMDMSRRLSGKETALVGYWHFEDGNARDYSPAQNHGMLFGQPIVEGFLPAIRLNGINDYISVPNSDVLNIAGAITLEAWVKPESCDGSRNIVVHGYPYTQTGEVFLRMEDSQYQIGIGSGGKFIAALTIPPEDLQGNWVHLAGIYDTTDKQWRLYRNGILAAQLNADKGAFSMDAMWGIGANADPNSGAANRRPFKGAIDEVRIWKRARTEKEIQSDMNRRLSGSETDLIGYWYFENGNAEDHSRYKKSGTIHGQPGFYPSPIPAYNIVAGVKAKFVQSRDVISTGNWTHLAVAYRQAYGLRFDGIDDYLDCGNAESLNVNGDLTIDVSFQVDDLSVERVILERSTTREPAGQNVPYRLSINTAGKIVFRFWDADGNVHPYESSTGIETGRCHYIMVTRKRQTFTNQFEENAKKPPLTLVWDDINIYVDSMEPSCDIYTYGDDKVKRAIKGIKDAGKPLLSNDPLIMPIIGYAPEKLSPREVGRSDGSLIIGKGSSGSYFRGTITGIRIWNSGQKTSYFSSDAIDTNGLISCWRFEERKGGKTNDSQGQNHATLKGAQWVTSDDPIGSSLKLYVNGGLKETNVTSADSSSLHTRLGECFQGEMEEVRIWQTVRTEEQIQDNLFRRIPGEREDMIAYYTFDAEIDDKISDHSLRGNHLTIKNGAIHVLSTAPIGEDTPQVRSALAGIRTPFSGRIESTPAVQEYGDMQYDSQGNLIGIFKRCYGHILDGKWQIITGYKVGDMVTEWIGQVQFSPQLMGFIEGAPPVPSENLTQPSVELVGDLDDYNQASSIELAEAQENTYNYSSTKEGSFETEVEFGIKGGVRSESEVGFLAITNVEESKFLIGPKFRFEASWGWLEEASTGITRSTGRTTSLELRGRYTTPEETTSKREVFGRRFVPDNTGLALVQSETADVFALRLRHNGALIAFQMRPNPDIPKDWNLIHFPINPRYVKQGTLDGKIGPVADVDYPNALTYSSDSSYFKPIEAYAIKNRIQREETALQTYYAQYAAKEIGSPSWIPSESAKEIAGFQALAQKSHRNLVNTYVWTTDGGLFAESQQTMDVQIETYGGSYDYKGMKGFDLALAFSLWKVAMQFDLNAMFGCHYHLSVNKSKESKTSFQLNVNLDKVERDIYKRLSSDRAIVSLDKDGRPLKYPYKVDAYRFMSFYLEPASDHYNEFFNRVVDPIWLEQSDDPSAVALRSARDDGREPPCWRVMHRVTYVSRILPPLDPSAPPSLEKTLQTLDIDSNYELIKQMEPYVRDHLASFAEFSDAVDKAIKTYLPELQPHKKEVKEYLSLYFGIEDGVLPEPQVEGFGEEIDSRQAANLPPVVKVIQYPDPLLLTGNLITCALEPTTLYDEHLKNPEDLFLTWEFLPAENQEPDDVAFGDPHQVKTTATFREKGQYRLRLTASDGILSSSDETVIVVNEAPVIESITAGKPRKGKGGWDVNLICRIQNGLGKPSDEAGLKKEWKLVTRDLKLISSTDSKEFEITESDDLKTDPGLLDVIATFPHRGHYLLELTVDNGLRATSRINLEIATHVSEGLQVLYTFESKTGTIVYDVSGSDSPLDLTLSDPGAAKWVDGGLLLVKPVVLSAEAGRLTEAIKAKNEISLEAWIKPAAGDPQGLRRILTLSNGPAARNFILAQNGNSYHAGLRTTDSVTDGNASLKSLAGGTTNPNEVTHVVFTRNKDGEARLYTNGKLVASRTICGSFSQWDDTFKLALGNEFSSDDRTDRAWHGEYHLVAIYDRALCEEEIIQNYEFGADGDVPPQVSAGEDRKINWSVYGVKNTDSTGRLVVPMQGRVIHDRPTSGLIEWAQIAGPKDCVHFSNASDPKTGAAFTRSGEYILRLTVSDGAQAVSKEVRINLTHEVPDVRINIPDKKELTTAGGVNTVTLINGKASLRLKGAILNSLGEEYPAGKREIEWECRSSDAHFDCADKIDPTVTFERNGVYELTLTVKNSDEPTRKACAAVLITVNQPPVVDAGPDQVIILPDNAILDTTVSDDGLPNPPGMLDLTWIANSKNVTFENPKADYTTASFSDKGLYFLKLSASDCAAVSEDEVVVTVNKAPVVDAGADATVKYNEPVPLKGILTDDGYGDPNQTRRLAISWEKVSGPEQPVFSNSDALGAAVTFPGKGIYVLKLTATTEYGKGADTVTFTVNQLPAISAGPDQTVDKNGMIALNGSITDDGLGDPQRDRETVKVSWKLVSGPGGAVFSNGHALKPTVTIARGNAGVGTYRFQLTIDNGSFLTQDTAIATVKSDSGVDKDKPIKK